MSCPKCGCQETYYFDMDDVEESDDMERCANCGSVFYSMDAGIDEDNNEE